MQKVSCITPLDAAFNGTRRILFAPWDPSKWFALGFSAWLARLGSSFISFPGRLGHDHIEAHGGGLLDVIGAYLPLLLPFAAFGAFLFLALALLCTWINARGHFMFLDNVVANRALVTEPWTLYREQGNSFFGWLLAFYLVALGLLVLLVGIVVAALWPSFRAESFGLHAAKVLIAMVPIVLLLAVVTVYIDTFAVDFVVPLMKKHRLMALPGWRLFGALFKQHKAAFLLYGLMRFLVGVCAVSAVSIAGLLTCCCGFLLLAIPYVNAVCLLPISVFIRLYSVEFLKQFGPEFDVMMAEPPPIPPSLFPPTG